MKLVGLDKKLFMIQHKITFEQLKENRIPEAELDKLIKQSIYNKTMEMFFQTTKINQHQVSDGILWEYKMFMFNEQDFFTLLKEVLELSDEDRKKCLGDTNMALGIKIPENGLEKSE